MTWFGADPGGNKCFGVAVLKEDGSFKTDCLSSVNEASDFIGKADALGIDCPLWWSSSAGGGRKVDRWLRSTYGIHPGTVQSINSLRGAVLVQGIMLAMRLRADNPNASISETHPKALLKALDLTTWPEVVERFGLSSEIPKQEHERDALLSAIVMREASTGRWTRDLSMDRSEGELDPKALWFGPVTYWWPH